MTGSRKSFTGKRQMPVRKFWRRVLERARKVLHETSSPHQIALGFTLGLALSMLPVPFVGLALGIGFAALLRANIVAAYLGSAVMNPLTGPFIFFAELWVGLTLVGEPVPSWDVVSRYSGTQWLSMLRQMIGPFGLGIGVAALGSIVFGYPLAYFGTIIAKRRYGAARRADSEPISPG
ncbi:MAG TPA: DUF2062 domain-containing protein [Myxococcota bacterium]|nr:DUF2062 domain-containing protein [Myxococcota bacterium]